jgi:hypothetical protein
MPNILLLQFISENLTDQINSRIHRFPSIMERTYPSSIVTNIAQSVNEYKSIQWLISVLARGVRVDISQEGKADSMCTWDEA